MLINESNQRIKTTDKINGFNQRMTPAEEPAIHHTSLITHSPSPIARRTSPTSHRSHSATYFASARHLYTENQLYAAAVRLHESQNAHFGEAYVDAVARISKASQALGRCVASQRHSGVGAGHGPNNR